MTDTVLTFGNHPPPRPEPPTVVTLALGLPARQPGRWDGIAACGRAAAGLAHALRGDPLSYRAEPALRRGNAIPGKTRPQPRRRA